MANEAKKGPHCRNRFAGGDGDEPAHLAETIGIARIQAIALIERHGNARATLVREARKLGK